MCITLSSQLHAHAFKMCAYLISCTASHFQDICVSDLVHSNTFSQPHPFLTHAHPHMKTPSSIHSTTHQLNHTRSLKTKHICTIIILLMNTPALTCYLHNTHQLNHTPLLKTKQICAIIILLMNTPALTCYLHPFSMKSRHSAHS